MWVRKKNRKKSHFFGSIFFVFHQGDRDFPLIVWGRASILLLSFFFGSFFFGGGGAAAAAAPSLAIINSRAHPIKRFKDR